MNRGTAGLPRGRAAAKNGIRGVTTSTTGQMNQKGGRKPRSILLRQSELYQTSRGVPTQPSSESPVTVAVLEHISTCICISLPCALHQLTSSSTERQRSQFGDTGNSGKGITTDRRLRASSVGGLVFMPAASRNTPARRAFTTTLTVPGFLLRGSFVTTRHMGCH